MALGGSPFRQVEFIIQKSERGEHSEHWLRISTAAGNKSSGCKAGILIGRFFLFTAQ